MPMALRLQICHVTTRSTLLLLPRAVQTAPLVPARHQLVDGFPATRLLSME